MLRVAGREVAVFAFFLLLAIALTWPFATHLQTAVPDQGDPLLNAWIVDWDCYAFTHAPLHLFQAPAFYPAVYPLAFSENLIGIAVMALPFWLAGLAPLTLYNLLVLLGFAHAGYCAYVLGRVVSRSLVPSLISGIFFGFVAFKFDHLSHLQLVWSGWLPLLLAALLAFWRKPDWGRAALLSAAFLMAGLTNIHFLLFGGLAVALTAVFFAIAEPHLDWGRWIRLVTALAVASLIMLPVLQPYRVVAERYQMHRSPEEVRFYSARWEDWLHTSTRSALYGRFMEPSSARPELLLFPGLLALFLTAYAAAAATSTPRGTGSARDVPLWQLRALDSIVVLGVIAAWIGGVAGRWKYSVRGHTLISLDNAGGPLLIALAALLVRSSLRLPGVFNRGERRTLSDALRDSRFPLAAWAAALWLLLGFLGSFGLNGFFHEFLYRHVEPFRAIRAVGRWALLTYVGLAAWTAIGAALMIERAKPKRRHLMGAVLLLCAIVDVAPKVRWEQVVTAVPPVYRWLNRERVGPVLELPMRTPEDIVDYKYMFWATTHHLPIMNGISGFDPPLHVRLQREIQSDDMTAAFTRDVEGAGCRIVVLHVDMVLRHRQAILGWLQSEMASGRLALLRRFDHGISGDYVFAVTRNLPDWPRFVDDTRDPAGFQPGENLARMLRGEQTYSASTIGWLYEPAMNAEVQRQMRVSGWVLSPKGIRSVDVLIQGGRYRYRAEPYGREDVKRKFPWYPLVPQPGFIVTIPKRPKGVPKRTDVQVEITDGAGRTTRLPDTFVEWH